MGPVGEGEDAHERDSGDVFPEAGFHLVKVLSGEDACIQELVKNKRGDPGCENHAPDVDCGFATTEGFAHGGDCGDVGSGASDEQYEGS